jgi:ABC-2 type transport system ATP-binding protein
METFEGYRTPSSGSVRVLGLDPAVSMDRLAPHIGVMLQSGGVYPGMSPGEAVRLFASYYAQPLDAETLLAMVGLSGSVAGTPWRRLSGGEQQRLSLALALVGRPRVAFLDEPTAGVDPNGRIVIRDVVRTLRDRGVAVLLTTHELDEAARLADRVVIINHGRVIAAGTPASLTSSDTCVLFGGPPGLDVASMSAYLKAPVVEMFPGEYRVEADSSPALVAAVAQWFAARAITIGDIRAGRQTLEDVFLRLTGSDAP